MHKIVGTTLAALAFIVASPAHAAPLSAPSNLDATAVSQTEIDLTWQDNASKEDGFSIERGTDGVNFSEITTVTANTEFFDDTTVSADTTYYYRVRAYEDKHAGRVYGDYSNTASDTTPPYPPADPTSLGATFDSYVASSTTYYYVDLSWTDNADNEDNYYVERSTDGVNFSPYATLSADETSYTDLSVSYDNTYYYRVYASDTGGNSNYSNVASTTIPAM